MQNRWSRKVISFHYCLIFLMLVLYFSAEHFQLIHETAGWSICILILLRIFYSIQTSIKSEEISSWFKESKKIFSFLKSFKNHKEGELHNPASSAMAIGFLLIIFLMQISGSIGLAGDEEEGLLSFFVDINYKIGEIGLNIHEFLGNFLIAMIVLHILGAIASSIISKQNLLKDIFFIRRK